MKKFFTLTFYCLFAGFAFSQGTWTPIATSAPHQSGGGMLLLSDGTVLVKTNTGGGSYGNLYDKLTPNSSGSYVNGSWSTIAPMINTRLYYSSQLLKDGRVYVAGGEYGTGGASGEVYDPLTNTWTAAPAPGVTISDANSEILEDGKVLQALVSGNLTATKIYDPVANTYSAGPTAKGIHNESAWVKLPDNSILYVNRLSTTSERYIPATNSWITDANVPVQLYDPFGDETGGALLLPDGRALFLGSSGHNAYYTPSGSTAPGTWAAAPDFPNAQGTPDAPAAMMVNGKVLCNASPVPTQSNHFPSPTTFYEFDPTTNVFTAIAAPGGGSTLSISCYITSFLDLPDGKVLYSRQGSSQYYVYTPGGSPVASGKPVITDITKTGSNTYQIIGTRFNGISEGAVYGDDWQMASNYPIVRLVSGSNVYYARTSNWNSTGVVRTAQDVATFTLPAGIPLTSYSLYVVANGIASDPMPINLGAPVTASVSIAITSGSNPMCAGKSVTFTATPTNGGTTPAYQWKVNNSSVGSNSATYSTTGLTNGQVVTCVMTSNLSGVLGNPTTSNGITMTVNSLPVVTADNVSGCAGTPISLSGSPSGGTWSVLNPYNGNSTTYTHTFIDVNGCSSTSSSASITVNPLPNVSFSGLAPTYNVGDPAVTLSGTPSGGTFSGTGISGNTFDPSLAGAGTFTITYSFTDANVCSNSSSQQTNVCSGVPATPGVISGQATGVCSSTIMYSISPVSGATTYNWAVPPGASVNSGQGSASVAIGFTSGFASGTVSVTAGNACGSSGASVLNVIAAPAQAGSISGPTSVCRNQNNITYSVASVAGAASYTWTVPTGVQIKTGQGTKSIKVRFGSTSGSVSVKTNNTCGSGLIRSLSVAVTCRDASEELAMADFDFNVFPNPFSDNTNVRFSFPESGSADVSVYDFTGRELQTLFRGTTDAGSVYEIALDGKLYPAGIYFLTLKTGSGESFTKRLIITK